MKKTTIIFITVLAIIGFVIPAFALPTARYEQSILPFIDNTYDLGSTSPNLRWKNVYTNNLRVDGTCTGCGGGGGGLGWASTTVPNSNSIYSTALSNVGVGTTSPNWKLSVAGIGSFDDNVRAGYFSATSTTATTTLSGGLAVGSNALNVLQNGNVGVGTASPLSKLSINGGLHVGGDSDAGDNNAIIDGTLTVGSSLKISNNGVNDNVFIGLGVGTNASAVSGGYNIGVGRYAMSSITTGGNNIAIGDSAGGALVNGIRNTALGASALSSDISGEDNTSIGVSSLYSVTGGTNTALGARAGYNAANVSGNVFIGQEAGYFETASNKLFIDNARRANEADARTKALVYGIFDATVANQYLTVNGQLQVSGTGNSYINGNIGIGTTSPNWKLSVAGIGSFDDYVRAGYFSATSTTATSTFSGYLSTSAFANTSMTSGSIPFYGAGGFEQQNNSNLFWDNTNTRLGIGTASPSGKLSVKASANYRNVGIAILTTGISSVAPGQFLEDYTGGSGTGGISGFTTYQGIFYGNHRPTTGDMASTDEFLRVDKSHNIIFSNGSVGIGNTSPYSKLSVWGANTTNTRLFELTNFASSTAFAITNSGHEIASTTAPSLSSCGTSPSINGTDRYGTVNIGATGTGCTVTYATAYKNAPSCLVSSQGGIVLTYSMTNTALTLVGATLGGTSVDYRCGALGGE